jgi:transcription antitermination factor NusG
MNANPTLLNAYGSIAALPNEVATQWFAVRTRSRHERVVERGLRGQGLEVFYPVVNQIRQWSDRKKLVETPLFAGYTFVRIAPTPEQRVNVLRTQGVVELVGAQGQGISISEDQIEAVRTVVRLNLPFSQHVFLKVGQRVRVRGGALDGVEGVLVGHNGNRNLVISVDSIQRSLSIRIEGYPVELV